MVDSGGYQQVQPTELPQSSKNHISSRLRKYRSLPTSTGTTYPINHRRDHNQTTHQQQQHRMEVEA